MLLAVVALVVIWVRWAQQAPPAQQVKRIPVAAPTVVSAPQLIANAVSEAEAKRGVTAGSKFTVTIKVLTPTHSEGVIAMEGRGEQNFTADLVNDKWQVTLQ
jgi:hypothetical protein